MRTIRPLEETDAEKAGFDAPWLGPSGGDVHRAGLWDGDRLVGAVRLTPTRRIRRAHSGDLAIRAGAPDQASALLGAACAFADRWTPLDRLQLAIPADDVAAGIALDHGFALEVRRIDRWGPGRDELGFGRLRPGFAPRPAVPPPPWPARNRRSIGSVAFRPVTLEDSAAIRDLSIELTAAWGTLQTPWSNERYYADRFLGTPPTHEVFAVLADGEIAGTGGIHAVEIPGVMALGMAIGAAWQGCGLGARLLDHLIARGWAAGARRIELGVWEDNERARQLYASRGFVAEGTLRCDSIRDGSHGCSVEMALLRR